MIDLDQTAALLANDPGDMLGCLRRLPGMARPAFERARSTAIPPALPRHVVVCGMGGSGISGDLARNLLQETLPAPITVVRQTRLPAWVGPEDLVIALTYSGNTAETLGCLRGAIARRIPTCVVSSGGEATRLAHEHDLPLVTLETGWMPRAALGELYFALLGLLERWLPAGTLDVEKTVAHLEKRRVAWDLDAPVEHNLAKQVTRELLGQVPLVYGCTPTTEAVSSRWKAQLNENAKLTVGWACFPELTHNEIVNVAHAPHAGHTIVSLEDPTDPEWVARQRELALDLMGEQVTKVLRLLGRGDDALTRQLDLAYLGDWVSVYLGLARSIDPTPVEAIFQLKDRMAAVEVRA